MNGTTAVADSPVANGANEVVGWSAVGVGLVGSAAIIGQRVLEVGPSACAARALLGIPCPVCGLSTAAIDLARGDVGRAVGADMLGVAFIAVIAVLALAQIGRLFGVTRWQPSPTIAAVLAGGLLLGHWLATVTGVVPLPPVT